MAEAHAGTKVEAEASAHQAAPVAAPAVPVGDVTPAIISVLAAYPSGTPPDDPVERFSTTIRRVPSHDLRRQLLATIGRQHGNAFVQRVIERAQRGPERPAHLPGREPAADVQDEGIERPAQRAHEGRDVVQRDPVPGAPAQTTDPSQAGQQGSSGGSTPDYSKMTWQQLLPHAHGAGGKAITKIDLHTPGNDFNKRGTGEAPTLKYVPDKDISTDPATGAHQGGVGGTPEADAAAAADAAALSAAQDAAISKIIAARAQIPDRPMKRSLYNNAGYDYNPDKDPAASDYNQWAKSALPTGVQATDWEFQVFKKIQGMEGQEGRFTTFDKTLSVGPGFSTSGGQTQEVIGKTFDLLPEVKAVAFAAGLTVDAGGAMSVVDTDKKWILDSQDAAAYLQTNVSLLSLLVNVSQGTQPVDASGGAPAPDEQGKQRQALLDAEWQEFRTHTLGGITSAIKGWPISSAVLAVHAKHAQPGPFAYSFWNSGNSPDLATMGAAIQSKAGESAKYICTGMYAQYMK